MGVVIAGCGATAAIVDATIMLVMLLLIPMAPAVPFCWIAICMNIAWLLSAVGLMLKVIPLPQ